MDKTIATEVFKSLHDTNPAFMIFFSKRYILWFHDEVILNQPKFNELSFSRNTFKYYG